MNKNWALSQAIEITKEYVKGEKAVLHPDETLQRLYDKLKLLSQDANSEG